MQTVFQITDKRAAIGIVVVNHFEIFSLVFWGKKKEEKIGRKSNTLTIHYTTLNFMAVAGLNPNHEE